MNGFLYNGAHWEDIQLKNETQEWMESGLVTCKSSYIGQFRLTFEYLTPGGTPDTPPKD